MNTLFPPGPFQQVVDVQAYMRTDAARAKRWPNIEHNLNAHTGSEHMASARRAGDGELCGDARARRGDDALALLTQSFQAPHPLSLANCNSQNSVLDVMLFFSLPIHA